MKGKRTGVDFSEHIVSETKNDTAYIVKFAKPNTNIYSINFINIQGVLLVTGDLGNWIFCREFHPSADGYVSDHYWCEKASIQSKQKVMNFSEKKTIELIDEMLSDTEEYQLGSKDIEYLEECKRYASYTEWEYVSFAHGQMPSDWDRECVPFGEEIDNQLQVIFDAFEEICIRMKHELLDSAVKAIKEQE